MKYYAGILFKTTDNNLLLQLRDNNPGIVNPEKIAIFGGTREKGESFEECAIREAEEELGLLIDEKDLKLIGTYHADIVGVGQVESHIFMVDKIVEFDAIIHEGKEIFVLKPQDSIENLNLTTVCRLVLTDYFEKNKP